MADLQKDIAASLPRLQRFAYTLTGSHDDADDLLQTACVKALARLDQFERGARLDTWMFRIVQTTWIDELSYQEVDDILEVPIGPVVSRLARARKKLAVAVDMPATSGGGR